MCVVYMCVHVHVNMHVCMRVYVCSVCVYVYMHVRLYVCIRACVLNESCLRARTVPF